MKNKNWFTRLPMFVQALLVIFGLGVVYMLYRKFSGLGKDVFNTIKNDSQIKQLENVAAETGIDPSRATILTEIAKDIYDAFWNTFFGMGEDEEKAANALDRCVSIQEAKAVARIYSINYKKNLWNDYDQYSSTWGDPRPRTELLNAIKGL